MSYTVTVTDPKGKVVGTSTESPTAGSGTSTVLVDLRKLKAPAGTYTFKVVGDYAASDPDTLDSDSALGPDGRPARGPARQGLRLRVVRATSPPERFDSAPAARGDGGEQRRRGREQALDDGGAGLASGRR